MTQLSQESNPEYAFIHIPKNAGMSIRDAILQCSKIKYFGHNVIYDKVRDYKQIIVLRDPIDRFTSAFFYLKEYKLNKVRDYFDTPEDLIKGILELDYKAFSFLKIHDHHHKVNNVEINTDWAFHPQINWVIDPYRVLIYEHLDEDFNRLCSDIGCSIKLPHINISSKVKFEYSKNSLEFLHMVYRKDIEIYNYYQLNRRNS